MRRYQDFLDNMQVKFLLEHLQNVVNGWLEAHVEGTIGLFKNDGLYLG